MNVHYITVSLLTQSYFMSVIMIFSSLDGIAITVLSVHLFSLVYSVRRL